jgi:hypothetical protein
VQLAGGQKYNEEIIIVEHSSKDSFYFLNITYKLFFKTYHSFLVPVAEFVLSSLNPPVRVHRPTCEWHGLISMRIYIE